MATKVQPYIYLSTEAPTISAQLPNGKWTALKGVTDIEVKSDMEYSWGETTVFANISSTTYTVTFDTNLTLETKALIFGEAPKSNPNEEKFVPGVNCLF